MDCLLQFFRWKNQDSENLRHLPKTTERVYSRAKTVIWFVSDYRCEALCAVVAGEYLGQTLWCSQGIEKGWPGELSTTFTDIIHVNES